MEEDLTLIVNADIVLEQVQSEHAGSLYALIEQEGEICQVGGG